MTVRYITDKDDPTEISDIYEQSWRFAYRDIIPQDFLDSIPRGEISAQINAYRQARASREVSKADL